MQLHFDNLRAALKGSDTTIASYPTIRRYLKAQGMFRQAQPKRATAGALAARDRLERLEVRSFEVDHVCALWHLDFHHGSRRVLTRQGDWVTPMLLGVIDDRSRLVCHLQWYLDETAESLIHALCQAFMNRGLPRALMTDNGAAMLAEETTAGLFKLGVLHQTTLPYSPYQNGKQESFWGRVEGRLMAMLEGEANLTLDALNLATQAWVEQEYHRTRHSEIDATPLAHLSRRPQRCAPMSCERCARCQLPHRGKAQTTSFRRHREPEWGALRDTVTVSTLRTCSSAIRPMGSVPGRSGRSAYRCHPVPGQAARQVSQCQRPAPATGAGYGRPVSTAADWYVGADDRTAGRLCRHGGAASLSTHDR